MDNKITSPDAQVNLLQGQKAPDSTPHPEEETFLNLKSVKKYHIKYSQKLSSVVRNTSVIQEQLTNVISQKTMIYLKFREECVNDIILEYSSAYEKGLATPNFVMLLYLLEYLEKLQENFLEVIFGYMKVLKGSGSFGFGNKTKKKRVLVKKKLIIYVSRLIGSQSVQKKAKIRKSNFWNKFYF